MIDIEMKGCLDRSFLSLHNFWGFVVMRGSRGETVGLDPPPLKNHKYKGLPSNTGPDPLNNHKAAKPAINVGSSSARQRNADDDPLLVV